MSVATSSRTFRAGAAALVVVCATALALTPVRNYDVWHHMKMGQYIAQHHRVPLEDLFSYNAAHPWVNPSWLADVALYAMHANAGTAGLVLTKAAMAAAAFAVLVATCRLYGLSPWGMVPLLLWAALAARVRFLCRPLIFSLPLLAAASHLLVRCRRAPSSRAVFWLPALTVLWANLHASFPLSLALVGLAVVSAARAAGPRPWRDPATRRLLAVGAACAAACFVSPFGWRQVWHALSLPQSGSLTQHPTEWWPMPFALRFFNPGSPDFLNGFACFWVLLAGVGATVAATWRKLDRIDLGALLLFTALALSARRHAAVFAIVVVPIAAKHAQAFLAARPQFGVKLAAAATAGALLLCVHVVRSEAGTGVAPRLYPTASVDFVLRHNLQGRMFNRWGWGSYIIWRCWPDRKVYADGRLEVYDPEVYQDHDAVRWARPGWPQVLDRHDAAYMIVPHNTKAPTAYQHPAWKLVFWDDVAQVYVRDTAAHADLTARYGCAESNPVLFDTYRRDPLRVPALIRQLERLIGENPRCVAAHRNLGKLRLQRQEWPKAVERFRSVADLAPRQATSRHDLGLALLLSGRPQDAVPCLRRVFDLPASALTRASAAFRLSVCYRRLGRPDEAQRWTQRSRTLYPGRLPARDG